MASGFPHIGDGVSPACALSSDSAVLMVPPLSSRHRPNASLLFSLCLACHAQSAFCDRLYICMSACHSVCLPFCLFRTFLASCRRLYSMICSLTCFIAGLLCLLACLPAFLSCLLARLTACDCFGCLLCSPASYACLFASVILYSVYGVLLRSYA